MAEKQRVKRSGRAGKLSVPLKLWGEKKNEMLLRFLQGSVSVVIEML